MIRGTLYGYDINPAGLLVIMLIAALLPLSCGVQDRSGLDASGDTGSVTFSVKWEPSWATGAAAPLAAPAAAPLAATDICGAVYSVTQVNLEVWRDGATPTSTGVSATAPCADHTATLTGVPAGAADLYVKITTTPQGWEGESARFTLSSGATQDLGDIDVDIPPMWYPATTANTSTGDAIGDPDVGIDDSGNAIAVWRQAQGAVPDNIFASRFTPGGGWGAENAIAPADTRIQGSNHRLMTPLIAMGGNGDAVVIWREATYVINIDAWLTRILASRFTPSGGWEAAIALSQVGEEADIRDWNVDADDSGNAVVVWSMNTHGATGTVFDIFASRYSASSTSWAGTRLTALSVGNNALYPHVAVSGGSEAFVVWQENTYDVYAQRFDGAAWDNSPAVIGTWSSAVLSAEPRVAVDSSGNAIAIWRSHDFTVYPGGPGTRGIIHQVISANRYAPSLGAWGDSSSIVDIGDAVGESGHLIAMDSAGNAAACWNYGSCAIGGSCNGAGIGTGYDALSGQWAVSPQSLGGCDDLGMDDSGNAITVFRPYIDPRFSQDNRVRASHYNAATMAWESPVTLQSDAQGDGPRIAFNGVGEAMAVWTQSGGSYIRPFASRYY